MFRDCRRACQQALRRLSPNKTISDLYKSTVASNLSSFAKQVSSSIGRVAVSKTVGWGFESLLACHLFAQ